MKKILFIVVIVLVIIYLIAGNKKGGDLVGSTLMQPTPTPVATPNAPKTYSFDSSTDLKVELDKVNPQVLDSDFE